MDNLSLISKSIDQTVAIGKAVGRSLVAGDIVALNGDLGAGKTQLVRGLAVERGGDPRAVSSPTFVLMQEYEAQPTVVHIDAYRINSLDEVAQLGWDEPTIAESISVIEWADRIDAELDRPRFNIDLEHLGETKRRITISSSRHDPTRLESIRSNILTNKDLAGQCPICKAPVLSGDIDAPFCSERCKQIDLGRWLGDSYKISRDVDWENDDFDAMARDESQGS